MNVLCLAVYYSDTCEEACRGGEVSSRILICIVFQTLISMYLLGTYCNVNIEYGMVSILFDEMVMRGAAMYEYLLQTSIQSPSQYWSVFMFETAVDIWLLLISSNCFAMHFAFCMVTYWFRIKFQRNVQANQINFGNVNTWPRQNI